MLTPVMRRLGSFASHRTAVFEVQNVREKKPITLEWDEVCARARARGRWKANSAADKTQTGLRDVVPLSTKPCDERKWKRERHNLSVNASSEFSTRQRRPEFRFARRWRERDPTRGRGSVERLSLSGVLQ